MVASLQTQSRLSSQGIKLERIEIVRWELINLGFWYFPSWLTWCLTAGWCGVRMGKNWQRHQNQLKAVSQYTQYTQYNTHNTHNIHNTDHCTVLLQQIEDQLKPTTRRPLAENGGCFCYHHLHHHCHHDYDQLRSWSMVMVMLRSSKQTQLNLMHSCRQHKHKQSYTINLVFLATLANRIYFRCWEL